jgi:hypothetical protein
MFSMTGEGGAGVKSAQLLAADCVDGAEGKEADGNGDKDEIVHGWEVDSIML